MNHPGGGGRNSLVARYAGRGAFAGLLMGWSEAVHLSTMPAAPGMLQPSVGSSIWFLAPVVDGAIGAAAGIAVAWFVGTTLIRPRLAAISRAAGPRRLGVTIATVCAAVTTLWFTPHRWSAWELVAAVLAVLAVAVLTASRISSRAMGRILAALSAPLLFGLVAPSVRPLMHTSASAGSRLKDARPNIILITLDTVRADHLSVYGYSRPTTPNLARRARAGVVFENAIAASPWTLASHASIFTGLLPHQHGADWLVPLQPHFWTLADALGASGYQTAAFTSNFRYGEAGWGLDEGFGIYQDSRQSLLHNLHALGVGRKILTPLYQHWVQPDEFERRNALELNHDVLAWFNHRSPRPFFLFINYFDAHAPYFAPRPDTDRFGRLPRETVRRARRAYEDGVAQLSRSDQASLRNGYDNCLAFLDDALEELLRALSTSPESKNTVLIITSDHGESLGEHGNYGHGWTLDREVLHVPLMMVGPGIPQGVRVSAVAETRNLFSTVMEIAGDRQPAIVRTSLRRMWENGAENHAPEGAAISELNPWSKSGNAAPMMSLTTDDWHYLRTSRGVEALFDLHSDPGEQVNLAQSSRAWPVLELLRSRLYTLARDSRRPWRGPRYLSALDVGRNRFVDDANSASQKARRPAAAEPAIGDVQAVFPPRPESTGNASPSSDPDLLRSLPYQ